MPDVFVVGLMVLGGLVLLSFAVVHAGDIIADAIREHARRP